jgi:hypothetical protein
MYWDAELAAVVIVRIVGIANYCINPNYAIGG